MGPQAPIVDVVHTQDAHTLFFGEWPGPEPTFVGVHGLTNQHRNFAGLGAALEGRMRLLAPDLIGRGASSKPPSGYGMRTHARHVLEVMDHAGVDRAFVGGHSMGAFVATAVAALHPDRVLGLVCIDGGVFVPPYDDFEPDAFLDRELAPQLGRLHTVYDSLESYLEFWKAIPSLGGIWGPIAESNLTYDLGVCPEGYRPKCIEEAVREDFRDLTSPSALERLRDVRCPILVLAATAGMNALPRVIGEAEIEVLRQAAPQHSFREMEGTDHYSITLSDAGARATTEAILEFVEASSSGAAETSATGRPSYSNGTS